MHKESQSMEYFSDGSRLGKILSGFKRNCYTIWGSLTNVSKFISFKTSVGNKSKITVQAVSLGKVRLNTDYNEVVKLFPDPRMIPFLDLMPITDFRMQTPKLHRISSALDELLEEEIGQRLEEQQQKTMTVQNEQEKTFTTSFWNHFNLESKLNDAVELVYDKRLAHLIKLRAIDQLPFNCSEQMLSNLFVNIMQSSQIRENSLPEDLLLPMVASNAYDKPFLIDSLRVGNISTISLQEEMNAFMAQWEYTKTILKTLREGIRGFFPDFEETAPLKTTSEEAVLEKMNSSLILKKKKPVLGKTRYGTDLELKFEHGLMRFEIALMDWDSKTGKQYKREKSAFFSLILDESCFVTIEIVRNLLVTLVDEVLLTETNREDNEGISLTNEQIQSVIKNNVNCIDTFVSKLAKHNLFKASANSEHIIEDLILDIWNAIVELMNALNGSENAYVVRVDAGKLYPLHKSVTFIARKYLIKCIHHIQEAILSVILENLEQIPKNVKSLLKSVRTNIDNLMDKSFLCLLQRHSLSVLTSLNLFNVNLSPTDDLSQFRLTSLDSENLIEILCDLLTMIKMHLLTSKPVPSPLYDHFVNEMKQYLQSMETESSSSPSSFRASSSFSLPTSGDQTETHLHALESQLNHNEKEMLSQYLALNSKLECIQEIAQKASQLFLKLGMR